ncbi:MAG: hypothetical protein ACT4PL_12885 [Phycisphaerales bacterium]
MLLRALLLFAAAGPFALPLRALPPSRVLVKDPIHLIGGTEVDGLPDLAIEHEGIEYRFASRENLEQFQKEPAKFAVACGGACGRMGPLSGLGDARRFALHLGRIYFFASDGCREGFLKDPARFLDADDPMPFGSNSAVQQGKASLDRLVGWAGGSEKLKNLKTLRATAERIEKQGDKSYRVTNETVVAFPERAFSKESWNDSWFSTVMNADAAGMATAKGAERIALDRARAFRRTVARWPVTILKAYVDGSPKADCPGLIVIAEGRSELAGAPVEHVRVFLNGAASLLTIDQATGRLISLEYKGRHEGAAVATVLHTFTGTLTVDGITLPAASTVTLDGKPLPRPFTMMDALEVNPKVAPGIFDPPAWPAAAPR